METLTDSEKITENKELQNEQPDNLTMGLEKTQLNEAIAEIIEKDLPTEQKTQQIYQMIQISQESFSGPIPHPKILQGYQELLPSAPERILSMAEKEQQHRIEMEKEMLKQNGDNISLSNDANKRSTNKAFFLVVLLIFAGVFLTLKGYPSIGIIIFSTTIISVAGIFIVGKLIQKKSDTNK